MKVRSFVTPVWVATKLIYFPSLMRTGMEIGYARGLLIQILTLSYNDLWVIGWESLRNPTAMQLLCFDYVHVSRRFA